MVDGRVGAAQAARNRAARRLATRRRLADPRSGQHLQPPGRRHENHWLSNFLRIRNWQLSSTVKRTIDLMSDFANNEHNKRTPTEVFVSFFFEEAFLEGATMKFNGCLSKVPSTELPAFPRVTPACFFLIAGSPRSGALRWPEHGER